MLSALDVISLIILLIMMMLIGNTIAMGVRERTREYGVLRALGFRPGHIRTFIMGEAIAQLFVRRPARGRLRRVRCVVNKRPSQPVSCSVVFVV